MADEQNNAFLELLRQAVARRWCMKPYCTTCGARDFRSALRQIGGPLGGPLAQALEDVDLDKLTSLPEWEGALEIAVLDIPLGDLAISLLESWLERAHLNLRFFDLVLYRLVRGLPDKHPVREKWIAKAITLAVQTQDFSLVESLILTLRRKALAHDQLMDIAAGFAKESKQMQRVLRNACKIDTDLAQQ